VVELCAIGATVPDILPGTAVRLALSTAQLSAEVVEVVVAVAVTAKPTVTNAIAVAILPVTVKTRIGVTGII